MDTSIADTRTSTVQPRPGLPRKQGLAKQSQALENPSAALSVRKQALCNGPQLNGLKGLKNKPFSHFYSENQKK